MDGHNKSIKRQQAGDGGTTAHCANPNRRDGAAIVSAEEEKQILATCGSWQQSDKRDAVEHVELLSICPDELILVCIQSPDTENRMSGGVEP